METMAMAAETIDKRRHLRHSVNEPCRATLESGEYVGAVVNMSVAGAAIHLDLEMDMETEAGMIIELHIQRIGMIRTRAVRSLIGGVAVEFLFNPAEDRALITRLWKVLNEYAPSAGRA